MPPVLDRNSFKLLISEEKDFIVCLSESGDTPPLFREVFDKFASKILILMCSTESCPCIRKHIGLGASRAILFFSGGRTIDIILDLDNKDLVFKKIEKFLKFSKVKYKILLQERIFQRTSGKLISLINMHYQEIGG